MVPGVTPTWKKVPFLRWSFWRMLIGAPHMLSKWQVGDGREQRLADFVARRARRGDPEDVIRVIDEFGYNESFLINVGDEKGRILEQPRPPVPERVVREESAFLVTDMMRSVLDEGTAASARGLGFAAPAAGKTGTTNDYRDAWFVGFTPDLLCVVWIGFDDNTPVGLSGTRAALPIWVDFMKVAVGGQKPTAFAPPPEGIVFVEIDRETGLLANPSCPKVRAEAFVAGTEPREPCFAH